jgi:hypothetical protein
MSGDKRTVSTDALETLGTIIDARAGRDAIHLAVEPVIAGCLLRPGQDVGLSNGKAVHILEHNTFTKAVGIVDPFLKKPVQPGERFWLVVYPRQITSLRHVWTHPAFEEANTPISAPDSKRWLEKFCDERSLDYDETIDAALHSNDGEDVCFGNDIDCDRSIPVEFWRHIEAVTGERPPRALYFRCAC